MLINGRWMPAQMAEGVPEGTGGAGPTTPAPLSGDPNQPMALDWRSSWPEDLRNEPSLKDFRDPVSLAKSYVATKQMVGDRVKFVQDWDKGSQDPEALHFRQRAGVPDSPDKYEIELAALPEGYDWDGELLGEAKRIAHEHAMTPAQLKSVLDLHAVWLHGVVNKAEAMKVENARKAHDEMSKLWGAGKQFKLDRAQRTLARVTDSETGERIWQKLEASGLGNDPEMVSWFANFYDYLPEDSYIADGGSGGMPLTTDGLTERIRAQMTKVHDLATKGDSLYRVEQETLNKLYQQREAMEQRQQNRRFVA